MRERARISLGAVNYCVRGLIERGLVKAGSFATSSNEFGRAQVHNAWRHFGVKGSGAVLPTLEDGSMQFIEALISCAIDRD